MTDIEGVSKQGPKERVYCT